MRPRLAFAALVLVASSVPALAGEPNHVRIVWNVQTGAACALVKPLSQPFELRVPSDWSCPDSSTADWVRMRDGLVQPGDFVTVYAVNYNAVSYKALAPVVTPLKPEEPVAITLLSTVLQAFRFPVATASIQEQRGVDSFKSPIRAVSACERDDFDAAACLSELSAATQAVEDAVGKWDSTLKADAASIAAARPAIPGKLITGDVAAPDFGISDLDAFACRFSNVAGKNPLGGACLLADGKPSSEDGWVQQVGKALGAASSRIRKFDSAPPAAVSPAQVQQRDRLKRAVDGWVEYLTTTTTGIRSELSAGAAQLSDDLAAIKSYRRALDETNAPVYAVELPRQGPVGSLHRLVFALPLRRTDDPEGAPARDSRTITVEVAPKMHVAMVSAGVMWLPLGTFDFKTLALEQVPNGSGGLSRQLVLADDTRYRDVTALAASHFRVWKGGGYFTLGTTADKNIFRNVLLGGSYFAPRLRSLFTVAALSAKGSKAKDLQPVIDRYSTNGFVPDAINLTQVAAPEHWYWTLAIAWTLTPF